MDDVGMVVVLTFWIVVGCVVGYMIGERKGNGYEGAILGGFLGPLGWLIALLMDYAIKCPHCRGGVPPEATVCKHCARDLPKQDFCPKPEPNSAQEWDYIKKQVYCPACGCSTTCLPAELKKPMRCAQCGVGFVPNPKTRRK